LDEWRKKTSPHKTLAVKFFFLDPDVTSDPKMVLEGVPVTKRDIRAYRIKEFAELAGITVRALHHYDRLGLLKPRRTQAGYRMYSVPDLERLEQIVALKFLGIPLKQIKVLLDRNALELRDALRVQRRVLEEKRRLLESAISAIRDAEASIKPGQQPDTALLKKIIEVIEMQNNSDWAKKYYSEGALETLEQGKQKWSPELQERVTKEWTDLFRDVDAAIAREENPASQAAKALGIRWKKLVEGFTGGNPEVSSGLNKLYADQANWPESARQQMAPFSNPKVWEFIHKVTQCKL
jgi:MerR family transcriptional regulator, thiopeptide resistance regulator